MTSPFVAVAGATGGLGKLVSSALIRRGATVKALVRPNTSPSRTDDLRTSGANIVPVDLADTPHLARELQGATCVVSTLQGLKDVIHGAQGQLLDASVAAQVPRFIPSDFSLDFTKTKAGSNRNLDLRRQFHTQLDKSGIAWTSILNGGFLDLMSGDSPMINHKRRKIPYIGQPTQLLDFTTMADTAEYTAAVATDPNPTPKILRIASVSVSVQDIADAQTAVQGIKYTPLKVGTVGTMELLIRVMRLWGGENDVIPTWQAMQYMVNMMSGAGKLDPLDNGRYSDLKWIALEEFFRADKNKSNE